MQVIASRDRDANRQPLSGLHGLDFLASKAVTFAAATTGSIAQHTLFTATGDLLVVVFGVCNTDLNSGGAATISVGTANNVAGLIAVTTATAIDDGEVWVDATPGTEIEAAPATPFILNDGADITYDVLAATITAGQIDFYAFYRPLEATASLVAA